MFPVHQQMSSRIGQETINEIYKTTNFDPSKM
jgi:C4-dicarboxylate-binding protein DctP